MISLGEIHFAIFEEEARFWFEYFGLYGWEIRFTNVSVNPNRRAGIGYEPNSRIAHFNLEPKWDVSENQAVEAIVEATYTPQEITELVRKAAFHEVMELFLARIMYIAEARYPNDDEAGEEIHNIIRVLENKVYPVLSNLRRSHET